MTPTSLPIPTDNIYKFCCLFGLGLIISCMFIFASIYSSTLEQNVKHSEVVILLESKPQRTGLEEQTLSLHKSLMAIAKSNERFAGTLIAVFLLAGGALSGYGGYKWHHDIQLRDDRMGQLQLEKLELEVEALRLQKSPKQASTGHEVVG